MRSLLLHVLLIITLSPMGLCSASGGNGSDRGGGDEYVADFLDVERSTLATIQEWVNDGTWLKSEAVTRLLSEALTIQVFSLESFPKGVLTQVEDGFWIDSEKSPQRITFLRSEWNEKKNSFPRVKLEALALSKLMKALAIVDSTWIEAYTTRSSALSVWKEEKSKALHEALISYAQTAKFLESNPYLIFEANLKSLFSHSDFDRCTGSGIQQRVTPHAREKACVRWNNIFWSRMSSGVSSRFLDEPILGFIHSIEGPSSSLERWNSERLDEFSSKVRSLILETMTPFKTIQSDYDESCRSKTTDAGKALCLESLRKEKHEESKTALSQALVKLDSAFNFFSNTLAAQVKAQ